MLVSLRKFDGSKAFMYAISGLFALFCLIPFLLVVGGSITAETEIISEGYKIFPREVSFRAYEVLFLQPWLILRAYGVTISVTVLGTVGSIILTSMLAYAISVKYVKYGNVLSFYVLITMLLNGGMVPWYIVCVNVLHLKNNLWALIVPYLVNGFNVFLIRNYFRSIPMSIMESARIDGADYFTIYRKLYMPLAKPVIATVVMFVALMYWNDWWLGIMLVDQDALKPLQLLLRSIVSNIYFLRSNQQAAMMLNPDSLIPSEGIKLATAMVTIGPIIFIYPLIQRHFVKGIMIGSVKG